MFDTVYMLTRGGPGTSTYVASMYNYVLFFGNYQVGYVAAMSYIILIIVNVFAIALIFVLSEQPGAGRGGCRGRIQGRAPWRLLTRRRQRPLCNFRRARQ